MNNTMAFHRFPSEQPEVQPSFFHHKERNGERSTGSPNIWPLAEDERGWANLPKYCFSLWALF